MTIALEDDIGVFKKVKLLDQLTDLTVKTEGLLPGQTPIRITNDTMRNWSTIHGVPIKRSSSIPADRRNFFFVEPGRETEVIRKQYKNYFEKPSKYGLSEDSTLTDVIKKFDQSNPKNKINLLQRSGIDPTIKIKDARKKFDLSALNPFSVTEAHADEGEQSSGLEDDLGILGQDSSENKSAQLEDDLGILGTFEPENQSTLKHLHFFGGAKNLLTETVKGVTRGTQQIVGGTSGLIDVLGQNIKNYRPSFNKDVSWERQEKIARQRAKIGETVSLWGRTSKEFWAKASKEGIAKPDTEIFKGSFMQNPSWIRGTSIVAEAIPSLGAAAVASIAAGNPISGLAFLGALEAEPIFSGAREEGVPVEKANMLFGASAIGTSILEILPITRFMRGGEGKLVKDIFIGSVQEGGEEVLQQVWNNVIEKIGFNQTKNIADGLVESFIGGAGSGGVIGGVTSGRGINLEVDQKEALEKGVTPQELDVIQETVKNQIVDNADKIEGVLQQSSKATQEQIKVEDTLTAIREGKEPVVEKQPETALNVPKPAEEPIQPKQTQPGEDLKGKEGVVEYHGTTPENAQKILKEGKFIVGPGQAGVSTTQGYQEALDYAGGDPNGVVAVRVKDGAEMVGKAGKDFLSGTGSFNPEDVTPLEIAKNPSPSEKPPSSTTPKTEIVEPGASQGKVSPSTEGMSPGLKYETEFRDYVSKGQPGDPPKVPAVYANDPVALGKLQRRIKSEESEKDKKGGGIEVVPTETLNKFIEEGKKPAKKFTVENTFDTGDKKEAFVVRAPDGELQFITSTKERAEQKAEEWNKEIESKAPRTVSDNIVDDLKTYFEKEINPTGDGQKFVENLMREAKARTEKSFDSYVDLKNNKKLAKFLKDNGMSSQDFYDVLKTAKEQKALTKPEEKPILKSGEEGQNAKSKEENSPESKAVRSTGQPGVGSERRSLPTGSAVESGDGGDGAGRRENSGGVDTARQEGTRHEVKHNYKISDQDLLGEGGQKTKYAGNIAAIKLLKKLESENRNANPEEQKILVKYVGWGGLSQAFAVPDSLNKDWINEYNELNKLLTPEEFKSARASTINAHYTAPEVIKSIWQAIGNFGFNSGRVLEPSAGIGHFIGLAPQANKKFSLVELDSLTGRIAKQLYQNSEVQVTGFQDAHLPVNFFDVIVSNIPFSDYKPFDTKAKQLGIPPNLVLHDYFFAKSLAHLKPGGILAFITSKGTMDKLDPKFREYLNGKAKFIGAIRLPSNAFKKNAGTEVVTDIIFLQKPMVGEKINNPNFVETIPFEQGGKTVYVNRYLMENSTDMVLGDMGIGSGLYSDRELTVTDTGDFQKKLNIAIESLPKDIYGQSADQDVTQSEDIEDHTTLKQYAFTVKDGKVYQKIEDKLVPQEFNSDDTQRVKGLISVRDSIRDLLSSERNDLPESQIEIKRKDLNKVYDSFVKKYGELNTKKNADLFEDDPDSTLLLSLENVKKIGKGVFSYSKGNIFKERALRPHKKPTAAKNIKDAIFISLGEYGKADWKYVGELINKPEVAVQEQALKEGLVFKDPDGEKIVLNDEYLSGNVKKKLKEAQAAAKLDQEYDRNVEELKKVQPADLTFDKIFVRIGMPWVKLDTYNQFLKSIGVRGFTLIHNSSSGSWEVEKGRYSYGGYYGGGSIEEYGTSRLPAEKIFERVANGKPLKVFDKSYVTGPDGQQQEISVLNEEETALAEQKADLMKEKFSRWFWEDDARREEYVKYYNENWNHTVVRKYDGSHLVFPSMNQNAFPEGLRKTQLSAIWRGISSNRLMLAHTVGAGKTAIMISTAMESKRLGLVNKSMVVAPKNTIPGWQAQINKLYPSAKVLVANEKTFSADKRKKFLSKVALGDWDIVVIPERSFEFIQVSKEAYEEYVNQELDELRAAKEEMKAAGSRISVKNIETSILKLQAKLAEFLSQSKKDDFLNFEELGIDALFVDEADKFKNLSYTTQKQGIKGMGTATGSMKASDMMMKTNILRNKNGKIVFATGTPISNSMVEAYTMMKYLQPEMLAEAGIKSFDDWSNTFGEVATNSEVDVTGGRYKLVSRFKNFVNVSELMKMIRQVWDIQTQDMLIKEGILERGKNLPFIKGGKPQPVVLQSSPDLQAYIKTLIQRADAIKKRKGPPQKGDDNLLSVLHGGRNASLDMRLIDPSLKPDPESKVEYAIRGILEKYKELKKTKGTQVVFIDRVAPDKTAAFNPQYYMKKKLIAGGIPANQIAFIHDYPKDEQKEDLYQKVNDGDIRVIFGSTEKLGAGTNIQERLAALWHIDVGWRPRDIVQREGRIDRPGNTNKEVEIYRLATKGSLDTFMFQLLEAKAKTIESMMAGEEDLRVVEEDDLNEYEALKALSSDNPMVKEKSDVDREVRKLKALNNAYIGERGKAQAIVKKSPQEIIDAQNSIKSIEEFKATRPEKPTKETFKITIGNKTFSDKKEALDAIWNVLGKIGLEKKDPIKIGSYVGYDLYADKSLVMDMAKSTLIIKIPGGQEKVIGAVSIDPVGTFASLDNSLFGDFSREISYYNEKIKSKQKELDYANNMLGNGFEKEKELQEKIARQSFIEKELQKEIKDLPITPIGDIPEPPMSSLESTTGSMTLPDINIPDASKINAIGNVIKYYLGTKEERWQSLLGDTKGRQVFEMIRFFDRAVQLVRAETEKRNKIIFAGIPKRIREYIFDVLKGIHSIDDNGIIRFGALQPAGIVSGDEYAGLEGSVLPDNRIVGEELEEGSGDYMTYRKYDTKEEYTKLIEKFPRARQIIEKYLANEEAVKQTILGTDIPAFSRNVLKRQFNIQSRQPEEFSYLPSVKKELRLIAKIKNIFRSYTPGGRKFKTGAMAEAGMEEKDLLKAYTIRQGEFTYEQLFNDMAGNIMALVLEPIENRQVKPGYVKVNINHPRIMKITEMKKELLKANGINPDKLSLFQYPAAIEEEFNIQGVQKFHKPELQAAYDAFGKVYNTFVSSVTTNYLVRPSTANRNFISGFIQYNLRTLTHFYQGLMGKGFTAAAEDVKALAGALAPSAIKKIPAEALGATFQTEIAQSKSIFSYALAPFRAGEYYFKRMSFLSDLNTAGRKKFLEDLKLNKVKRSDFNKYMEDFKENYFADLFQLMSDNADSVTYDYWNKPYILEKLAKYGKGLIPYPNYIYHKFRMYAEYSPAALVGMNKGNMPDRLAKMLAGLTVWALAWMLANKAVKEREKQLNDLAFKKIDFKFDTTGRLKFYSDNEVDRWLRVYDWPILGDMLYWREIKQGSADFGDWASDALSLGPILQIPLILMGLRNKYQGGKTTLSLVGEQVAGWFPFGSYLRYARVLQDPIMRKTFDNDYSAFENFVNPMADLIPGVSRNIPERVAKTGTDKGKVRKYDIPSETMKLLFLNIKSIDKQEYMNYVNEQIESGKVQKRIEKAAREKNK